MKHLKIYFAVLFFSFLGAAQNQLFAQEPTKNAGSSTQTLNADEYLENGDYRAKLAKGSGDDWAHLNVVIYKKSDNTVVQTAKFAQNPNFSDFKFLGFDTSNPEPNVWFILNTAGGTIKVGDIAKSGRGACVFGNQGFKILNTEIEATKSAYLQLESDGRLVIYSGTGGTPIIEVRNRI